MYEYNLIDGVYIDGELVKTMLIKSMGEVDNSKVERIVCEQYSSLVLNESFHPVNDRHLESIKGVIYLNEHTAASISKLGEHNVSLTFSDLCEMKITAQDWQVMLCAGLAVSEFDSVQKGELLA